MPYAKLKTTYNPYQGSQNGPQFGATPPGWWAIIGSNKDQATVINPDSPISTSGTCNDFSPQWSKAIGVPQGAIQYYYDSTSDPGTLTCKTTQDGAIRTVTLTCSGDKCCGGGGLNGLIPKGVSFPGQVRPGDTSKPQCIENINPPKPDCGPNGTWVTNIDYASGILDGYCMCDGGWTNTPNGSRINPCNTKVMCPDPDNCGEGCNTGGNTNCNNYSWFCHNTRCQTCCSHNEGCYFMDQPRCVDNNYLDYPCWCNNGPSNKGEQLMITSGVPVEKNAGGIQKYPSICDSKKGDNCCGGTIRGPNGAVFRWPEPGHNDCQDLGLSYDGERCVNPGNSSTNGIGCGWKLNPG